MGLRNPLKHLRGKAIQALRSEGIQVDVVGEDLQSIILEVTKFVKNIYAVLLLLSIVY